VLDLCTVASPDEKTTRALCADAQGFGLHAAARINASNSNGYAGTSPALRSPTNA